MTVPLSKVVVFGEPKSRSIAMFGWVKSRLVGMISTSEGLVGKAEATARRIAEIKVKSSFILDVC